MTWDPTQYLKFADHRLRPAIDLLARVDLEAPGVVYDLGAGAGNVTALLSQRFPQSTVIGIDSSEEMLRRAAQRAPNIRWQRGDIATWRPEQPTELIFSNAALHWVPDHRRVFGELLSALSPGGVLAVQMPRNFGAASHRAMAEAARSGPWRATLEPLLRPAPVEAPQFYIELLCAEARSLDVWETCYMQILEGENPVKEWTKGTWLRPLLDALEESERSAFEAVYAALVAQAYPKLGDGTTVFPFTRLFIVATR